ncbi:MAG: hypothetical protein WCP93_03060 [Candidatus Berkelbacteria bacterium]
MSLISEVITIIYAGVEVVGIVAYWPTIKDLFHKKPSANISSYLLWTATGGATFLYSIFVLPNLLFQIVSGFHFVSCAIILILSLGLRRKGDL